MPASRSSKSSIRTAAIIAAAVVAAFVLNPDEARHDRAIRDDVARQSSLASVLGGGRVMGWLTRYHSVGVASYTEVDGEVVSYGAFGVVFVK